MHSFAGCDGLSSKSDNLIVPPDRLSGFDLPDSNLVTGRNDLSDPDTLGLQPRPKRHFLASDNYVIQGM
jgi:hypothetical protein